MSLRLFLVPKKYEGKCKGKKIGWKNINKEKWKEYKNKVILEIIWPISSNSIGLKR